MNDKDANFIMSEMARNTLSPRLETLEKLTAVLLTAFRAAFPCPECEGVGGYGDSSIPWYSDGEPQAEMCGLCEGSGVDVGFLKRLGRCGT